MAVTLKAGLNITTSAGVPIAAGTTITGQTVYATVRCKEKIGVVGRWHIKTDSAGAETSITYYAAKKYIGDTEWAGIMEYDKSTKTHSEGPFSLPATASNISGAYDKREIAIDIGDSVDRVRIDLATVGTAWADSTSTIIVDFQQDNRSAV